LQVLIYYESLEVVAKAIYPLNFFSESSMCSATVGIISGLRRSRKYNTAPFFHEHGSSPGALGFHECGSGACFFHGSSSGFWSFS